MQKNLSINLSVLPDAFNNPASGYGVTYQETNDQNGNNTSSFYFMPVFQNSAEYGLIEQLIASAKLYIPNASPDPLAQVKARKIAEVDAAFKAIEAEGFLCNSFLWTVTKDAVALANAYYTLAKEKAAANLPLPKFYLANNFVYEFLDMASMTAFMGKFNTYRNSMDVGVNALKYQINTAADEAAANAVDVATLMAGIKSASMSASEGTVQYP